MRTTAQWTISLPPFLSKKALRVAKTEFRTKSELVREALRYYMERRILDKFRQKFGERTQAMGIRNEKDVERLIDEDRT